MSAYTELQDYLTESEVVEAIVFGAWGWGEDRDLPKEYIGKVLSLEAAEPHMQSWNFNGGFGSPECYATYIWTNERVIWITQYDGATGLDSMPRNPSDIVPNMPGG